MKPVVRCLFVVAGILAAEAAISQVFKNQAAAAASQSEDAFNSGDASKVAQGYTKTAVILPAGANKLLDRKGPRRSSEALSRAASRTIR